MATLELDPVFVKALRLLHSRAKDSANQLRAMVDESIAARKSQKGSDPEVKSSGKQLTKEEETKKREGEKRTFDKLKQDISELGAVETKRAKLDPSASSQSKEERKEREKEKEKARKEKERKEQEKEKERERERQKELEREKEKEKAKEKQKEAVSDEDTEDEEDGGMAMDADDFAIGLGISCEVCRQFDVTSGNQLVECQECHALYHQECHKPPVTEQDVNDPRFVWYCNKCSKTVKKVSQKPPKTKTAHPTSSKEPAGMTKSSKTESNSASTTFAFRRVEIKPSIATTKESHSASSSSKPLLGFASLAANLSKPATSKSDTTKPFQPAWKADITKPSSKEGKTSKEGKGEKAGSPIGAGSSVSPTVKATSGNGSKQPSLSASSMASVNQRLQKMKKNAAKLQEKRVHIK